LADILANQAALVAALQAGTDLTCYVGSRDSVEVPCLVVPLPEVEYDADFGADTHLLYAVRYLVGRADETVAQERIADAMSTDGATSIPAAVNADPTLDGTCDFATVTRAGRIGVYTYGEITYLGAEFTVDATT
jgi:hypothetical protein